MELRVARPTRHLGRSVAFYRDAVGLEVLTSFEDHDAYSGVILRVPDTDLELELVAHDQVEPSPTAEDQLVLYLGSADAVAARAASIRSSGHDPQLPANPYWARHGAVAFVDPDGYWLILSPE
jgi:catechol 2,3-dioxygenase-like lactoylglutathione lyase family enzyme